IVGADRVTRKGDVANKIGTYTLAVLAAYHKIPFYVVAPSTTLDQRLENGWQIPIEERSAEEVTQIWNLKFEMSEIHRDSPPMVVNPAFDVTPYSLITKIITEKGFFVPS
ncbi:MAG: S-methyl-5-thioribose-1-phosphate isomerase, partial [Bdellovibrionaceae bacterium]|nr:S-methyl-5-thioribose-1-phosphate isomerase [Pseudobdellovibrionaceae bacterium]MDW8190933.1 S-methyl-5-thioribose-1-phosphate isomerase [Pseudobdellovibrionaceae bacterium]